MGLSSSKVDTYVLRVDESNGKNLLGNHSTGEFVKPKLEKSPTLPTIALKHQKSKVIADDSNALGSYSYGNGAGLGKESKDSKDTRRGSSHGLNSRAMSAKITAVTGPSMAKSGIAISPLVPWLIKSAKFNDCAITDFQLGRIIGKGLMGTVRTAKTKNDKYFAIKSISKEYIVKHKDQRHVQSEKEILGLMTSAFCIKLYGTFQDKHNVYFALEYAPGGELFSRLGKKKYFSPDTAKFYISEVFVALEHVQSLGFVYRDLKPENVILDEEGHCKLVDFGFTTRINPSGKLHTLCGTPAYLSPEQLDGKFTNGYTEIVDWWSFGVLIYELLTGKTPFCRSHKDSHYEIFLRILKSKIVFPLRFDSTSKQLVSKLCCPQVEKRLCSPEDIKVHRYFEIEWSKVANRQLVPPFVPRLKDPGDNHYFSQFSEAAEDRRTGIGGNEYFDF